MTSKEAKKILNEYRNRNYNSTFRDELELAKAIDTVLPKYVELVERDMPMKPIDDHRHVFTQYNCSVCNSKLDTPQLIVVNFCHECGQRIDWSDDND